MKKSLLASAATFVAAAALVFGLVTPASASTWNAQIAPPSSITLNPNIGDPQTFPLGAPPTETPPPECGVGPWEPTVLPLNFDNDTAPTSVSASFSFPPFAMDIAALGGWKRVEITNVAFSGTVNPTTGAMSGITGTANVTFKTCGPGFPTECATNATIGTPAAGTGTMTPEPPITSATTGTLNAEGVLATTAGCDFTYVVGLNGATFNLGLAWALEPIFV